MEISEKELRKDMTLCGIPKVYHDPERGLGSLGAIGDRVKTWLNEQDGYSKLRGRGAVVVRFVDESPAGTDAFYFMARACLIRSVPVRVFSSHDLLDGDKLSADIHEELLGVKCLFIDGFVPEKNDALNSAQYSVLEWFATKWILDGKALVLLGSRSISAADFSNRFIRRISEHTSLLIENFETK